mgnify:CR=1 FL=1
MAHLLTHFYYSGYTSRNLKYSYALQVTKSNPTAAWKTIILPLKALCNGDQERVLKFVVWDWDRRGRRDIIGEFETTLGDIRNRNQRSFELINTQRPVNFSSFSFSYNSHNLFVNHVIM